MTAVSHTGRRENRFYITANWLMNWPAFELRPLEALRTLVRDMADNPEPPLSKRPRLSAEGEVEGSEQMRGGSGGVGELQEETEAKRDAYYLANFKSILSSVLTDSHVTTKMDHVTNDGHVTTELDHVTNDYCPCAPHTIDHDNVISEGHVIGKSVRSIVDRFTRLAGEQVIIADYHFSDTVHA